MNTRCSHKGIAGAFMNTVRSRTAADGATLNTACSRTGRLGAFVNALQALLAFVLAVALFLLFILPAYAHADEQGPDAEGVNVLSSRYASLDALENSTDKSDNVVTTTNIKVLVGANRSLDNATVVFTGEVVGDMMNGGNGHKWVNLLGDDGSSIGVLVTDEMAERVENTGDNSTTGSTLQVRGKCHIDCGEHQGELDVHALDIRVLDAGGPITHYADGNDVKTGLVLCAGGFVLLLIFIIIRWVMDRREERKDREAEAAFKMKRMSRKAQEQRRLESRQELDEPEDETDGERAPSATSGQAPQERGKE